MALDVALTSLAAGAAETRPDLRPCVEMNGKTARFDFAEAQKKVLQVPQPKI